MSALERIDHTTYEVWDEGERVAIIKKVRIGYPPLTYWRSVTGDNNPSKRALLGYFPSLEFATHITWKPRTQNGIEPVEQQSL